MLDWVTWGLYRFTHCRVRDESGRGRLSFPPILLNRASTRASKPLDLGEVPTTTGRTAGPQRALTDRDAEPHKTGGVGP